MKVVLFCGGFGMRLREYSETVPKPMVPIGYRPILWHVMKYYAHYGHKDFILCLGWQADAIKRYFLSYDECVSNDFVLSGGGSSVELLASDIADWRITFVDTGTRSSIGQRLQAVEEHPEGEETFLANYSDGLTDLPLPRLLDLHRQKDATATFLSVKPAQSFHTVTTGDDGYVSSIAAVQDTDVWINAGFFVLQQDIFRQMRAGEELVEQPFSRLIQQRKLACLEYDGFFGCMDTFKEKQILDDMHANGEAPWEVWNREPAEGFLDEVVEEGNRLVEEIEGLRSEIGLTKGELSGLETRSNQPAPQEAV